MAAQSDGLYFDTTVISSTWQDTSATIPADDIGEAIGRANDLRVGAGSPHNGIQSSASLRPLRQTTGAKFDGSDDNWLTTYTAGSGANFIVALVDVPASISTNLFCGASNSGADRFFLGVDTSGVVIGGVGAVSTSVIRGTVDRRGTQVVVGISCDGSTSRLFDDDAMPYEAAQSGAPTTAVPFRIGAYNNLGSASLFFGGSIKKLVAGREFLTLARYQQIRNALLA